VRRREREKEKDRRKGRKREGEREGNHFPYTKYYRRGNWTVLQGERYTCNKVHQEVLWETQQR